MMNKKGFTLIELLVVIGLIAVISTSITLAAMEMLARQQDNMKKDEIENIENAACTYAEVEGLREDCTSGSDCNASVTTYQMITEGYLDKNTEYSGTVVITWDINGLKKCVFTSTNEEE